MLHELPISPKRRGVHGPMTAVGGALAAQVGGEGELVWSRVSFWSEAWAGWLSGCLCTKCCTAIVKWTVRLVWRVDTVATIFCYRVSRTVNARMHHRAWCETHSEQNTPHLDRAARCPSIPTHSTSSVRYIHRPHSVPPATPLQYRSKTHISHQTRPKLALILALLSPGARTQPGLSPPPHFQILLAHYRTGQVRRIQGLSARSETSLWGCDQRFQNPNQRQGSMPRGATSLKPWRQR